MLYTLEDFALAPANLKAWLACIQIAPAALRQARPHDPPPPRRHPRRDPTGLSNGRLEGLNSRIRLISHRSSGFHSADALIALVYLCCTGIVIELPR